ncbi:hypothetical protein JCM5350_003529 [Sporobolomyces pararoseus]
MIHFQRRPSPSRKNLKPSSASPSFRKVITNSRQQLSPLIVEALTSIRQAELIDARLKSAARIQREEGTAGKLRYVEMKRNGGEEREKKRAEMNKLVQSYWLALESSEAEGDTPTSSWDSSKVFLGIFKLNYLLVLNESGQDLKRARRLSGDSMSLLARRSLGRWLQFDGRSITAVEDVESLLQKLSPEEQSKKLSDLNSESKELEALATAIARVTLGADWQSAVKAFVKLHTDLIESYRDVNWRESNSAGDSKTESLLREQVDKEIERVELALDRAERRRDWAIVDLIFERVYIKKAMEKRRAEVLAVA